MALSDACSEFLDALASGSADHEAVIKQLAAEIERYDDGKSYWGLAELREGCAAVLATPSATNLRAVWLAALVRLVVLAEQVRAYHDQPPP